MVIIQSKRTTGHNQYTVGYRFLLTDSIRIHNVL